MLFIIRMINLKERYTYYPHIVGERTESREIAVIYSGPHSSLGSWTLNLDLLDSSAF